MYRFIITIIFLIVAFIPIDCFTVNFFYWLNPNNDWFKECYNSLPKFLRFIK